MATEKILELEKTTVVNSINSDDRIFALDSGGNLRSFSFDKLAELVRGTIQIGGRNLLKNSGIPKSSDYRIGAYAISERLVEGRTYTVTAYDVIIGEGKEDRLSLWDSHGGHTLSSLDKVVDGVYSGTFVAQQRGTTYDDFAIYSAPRNEYKTTIGKLKLEEGNMSTAWAPAPEDGMGGGKNTLLLSKLRSRVKALLEVANHSEERRAA